MLKRRPWGPSLGWISAYTFSSGSDARGVDPPKDPISKLRSTPPPGPS
jgi:hypothetical protein